MRTRVWIVTDPGRYEGFNISVPDNSTDRTSFRKGSIHMQSAPVRASYPSLGRWPIATCSSCGNRTTFVYRDGDIRLFLSGSEAARLSGLRNIRCGRCLDENVTVIDQR